MVAIAVDVVVCDVDEGPGHEGRIAVLAVDVRVDVLRADVEPAGQRGLQAAGVENGAGADDMIFGHAGDLMEHIGQHVDRVGHDDIERVRRDRDDLGRDVLHDIDVDLRQLQTGLTGLARHAGRDDDDVGIGGSGIVAGTDDGRRAVRHALIDVQRLAERLRPVDVDQNDLRCDPLDHQVIRDGCPHIASADNSDLTHCDTPLFIFCIAVPSRSMAAILR